jgi:integrase
MSPNHFDEYIAKFVKPLQYGRRVLWDIRALDKFLDEASGIGPNVKKKFPYVHEYRDRHGKVRRVFRKRGHPLIALKAKPGTREFFTEYSAAHASLTVREVAKDRSVPGTVNAAIAGYYTYNSFAVLGDGTRKAHRAILENFRREHGDKRLATLTETHIAAILGTKKPFAARNWLKALRGLMRFAASVGLRPDDPTANIKRNKVKEGRIHTWTEEEIERFESHHPIGSRARLAMALLLYTGQRRSDVVKMGPQHIHGGRITVRQIKTDMENQDEILWIPLHPSLREILKATPSGHLTFLVTAFGKPFSADGFGNLFREYCDEAGLPDCSSHGLRKAQMSAARRSRVFGSRDRGYLRS